MDAVIDFDQARCRAVGQFENPSRATMAAAPFAAAKEHPETHRSAAGHERRVDECVDTVGSSAQNCAGVHMRRYSAEGVDAMTKLTDGMGDSWWGRTLDELDTEVARLSAICNVRILDPGVIERVIHNDATVCGTGNPIAFDKLRQAMMMHLQVRQKAVGSIGEAETAKLIAAIVERLRKRIGDQLGSPTGT
jgi:hypothetical protein